MEKINFQDNITKANAETMNTFQDNIENAINEVLNIVCPIGKVEIFFDNEDHSNYLGLTWERTSIGKTPIGIDSSDSDFNAIGKTGGEKTHKLTNEEMPNHSHKVRYTGTGANGPNGGMAGTNVDATPNYNDLLVAYEGGDQPHNNLQPYQVMAFWKRVA